MTREIKFRAWDKLDNKMYYNVGISLIGVQIYANPDNQPPEDILLDRGRDLFELMQYTGLKDKNGLEIYEGDIVEGFLGHGKKEVVWTPEGRYTGWFAKRIPLFESGSSSNYLPLYQDKEMEVIGNVWENPDLIKKEEGK